MQCLIDLTSVFKMKWISVLLIVGSFCHSISSQLDSPRAVRIISPRDHLFHFEKEEFNNIVKSDNLKDRFVVIASIAGAFRQGKSFLLNFFLKYLHAQYKKHDITDWIGENDTNSELHGFSWRGGRKRTTVGIWMWSEVFTHDYENGEKVAIFLVDTQGIFDDKSSISDCITIFALSMMISSAQCYNLKENIKEDNLQLLELFTEYGRLSLEQTNTVGFQKLLFIVRDWPYPEEGYGWNGQKVIDELLSGNDEQTYEMKQTRERITSSFDEISAFLLPYPGRAVAQNARFNGNISEIDVDFIKYVKILTTSLFDPNNLVIKKINGQKVRVRDLVFYLESFTKILGSNTLPGPKSILNATIEASMLILENECVHFYIDAMDKAFNNQEFFTDNDLAALHQKTKNESIEKFQRKPKLGDDQYKATIQTKIDDEIEQIFISVNHTNEEKRKYADKRNENISEIVIACSNNEELIKELKEKFNDEIVQEINRSSHTDEQFTILFNESKHTALDRFDARKSGTDDIAKKYREKLGKNLDGLFDTLKETNEKSKNGNGAYVLLGILALAAIAG